ncbi:MAG: HAD-IA family hydrolase [Lachnospiraceae bacterium]|nr:HAD-IA family hydrolase [Lachnospiraceae bacterium]
MNKTVCFDFDGVIISSIEVQRCAFKESYHQATGKYADEKLLKEFFHNSGDSLKNIFQKMELPLEMIEPYRKISIDQMDKIRVFEGMRELLEKLKRNGILCGLCTGKDRTRTLMILDILKLDQYFTSVVCSDDVSKAKPDPESLFTLMKNLNADPDNVVMVGDANNDVKCARSAKVPVIGVSWGDVEREVLLQDKPDYLADTVSELDNYIGKLLKIKEKKKFLFEDLVVVEDLCNMRCEYCLTQTSQFKKESNEEERTRNKLSCCSYVEGSDFKYKLDTIQENILEEIDIAILKISGGEILLLPEIHQYILNQAKRFKGVQVLTNGVLLNEQILMDYKEANNICLQISLDHHTMEGNSYRTKKESVLERILYNIDLANKYGVPVEINCVLTDKNTGILKSFLDYLNRYDKGVIVFPFPVRGSERKRYYMKKEQIVTIEEIINCYDVYKNILAPKEYMKYLLEFLKTGKRKTDCSLPYMAVGVFEDGTVTPCPNYWFTSLGSILEDKHGVAEKVGEEKIYHILTCDKNPLKECHSCFTPWEIFNLYVEGILTYEELLKSPSYSFEGMEEYIKSVMATIIHKKSLSRKRR